MTKIWPRHIYRLDPTVLRTNRQIYSEAYTVLYDENMLIRVRSTDNDIGVLLKFRGIPYFLKGPRAEQFKHGAMSVDFDCQDTTAIERGQEDKPWYVIALDDLQSLWQSFTFYRNCVGNGLQHYEFRVNIHRMFGDTLNEVLAARSPQRRLLEPFTVLDSITRFEITGSANTKYCASIAARVSRKGPTVEECFDEITELKRKGLEQYRRNDLEGATQTYKMAISQLIYNYCSRTLFVPDWPELHPQQYEIANGTKITLMTDLAILHYNLGEFEDAHFWACDGAYVGPGTQMAQFETLFAKLVYVKALASIQLGRFWPGVEELCKGLLFVTERVYQDTHLMLMRYEAARQIGPVAEALKVMRLR